MGRLRGRRWRWAVVAAGTAVLVALPFAAHLLPAGDSSISASTLLTRINTSADVRWSGYAQSQSGLGLPAGAGVFGSVDDLFGSAKRLRVWWDGSRDWRVDSIGVTGETDLHQDATGIWTWDYETDSAQRNTGTSLPLVRLPRSDDLVPATLARRLLSEASPSQVSRLPGVRVAGAETAGLRVTIDDRRSTLRHIDVWALPGNGLPVQVEVYGAGVQPILSTRLLDLTLGAPDAATLGFHAAGGVQLRSGAYADVVAVIDQLGRSEPPQSIAGFARRPDLNLGAVGVYGRGATELVALPLSSRLSGEVVPQLRHTPGMVENASGIALGLGTLNLQLSPPTGFGARWLLIGTVTPATLLAAVPTLPPALGFGFGPGGPRR